MRRLLFVLPLLALLASLSDAGVALQRYLESLKLGDTLKEVEIVYPPRRNWGSYRDPRGNLRRVLLDRSQAKYFPVDAENLRLGFSGERLAHIQVIYTREASKKKPLGNLVVDLSLIYGEPRRIDETYFWWDNDTVIAVSDAMLASPDGRGSELRTSLELMDYELFEPLR
ncbi:MAG: hypothetical protein AUJ52_08940 [Elusimicrobia bacterium CG1_02_63_36]|nr:MAG: hypothetical protein AUJ52_08940 [Elusimicrobia bacterium CG1_02_63_36]PIP84344.1 MAG: hypothetical protein COR54_04700 [Elusimicrobia bacterium CG22_combo_CG10-13_8_21_14_all_63_91]PJA17019.1 MAG: hypothetical protein COX66_05810 [Elusimicrobia bacterium CG_4_10_14_0_2_um_filter_63_34]PJB25742.1 MAG: hypothetical protein CO113_07060 [Elusimicrobia bacterium CG_4_9_14_3_um_filter_62_55]